MLRLDFIPSSVCRGLTMPSEHTFWVYYILNVGITLFVLLKAVVGLELQASRNKIPTFLFIPTTTITKIKTVCFWVSADITKRYALQHRNQKSSSSNVEQGIGELQQLLLGSISHAR